MLSGQHSESSHITIKFVPRFSAIAAPLNKLLRNDIKWLWEEDHEQEFQALKATLCSKPVLRRPDLKADF